MFFFSSYNFWHRRCQATMNEMCFAYKFHLTNIAADYSTATINE